MTANNVLYLRGIRIVDLSRFCLGDKGMKRYFDPVTRRYVPFSSPQQVKRSIRTHLLNELDEEISKLTFKFKANETTGSFEQKELILACNPKYADQLIGGYMDINGNKITRRSPLSISGLLPLHSYLSSIVTTCGTVDRTDFNDDVYTFKSVNDNKKNGEEKEKELTDDELSDFLKRHNNPQMPKIKFISDIVYATGVYKYDVAIDLNRLFKIDIENEITETVKNELISLGWIEIEEKNKKYLLMNPERIEEFSKALSSALINWMITSNQSLAFSLMPIASIVISKNANKLSYVHRTDVYENEGTHEVDLKIETELDGCDIFHTPLMSSLVNGFDSTDMNAIENAEKCLHNYIMDYYSKY